MICRELLERAADKLQVYCTEVNGYISDSLADEIRRVLAASIPEADYWQEDTDYPLSDWKYEVTNDDTRQGYHDWKASKRESEG